MAVLASDFTSRLSRRKSSRRGTLQFLEDIALYRHLGIKPPPLHLLINDVHPVSGCNHFINAVLHEESGCSQCGLFADPRIAWQDLLDRWEAGEPVNVAAPSPV